MYIVPVSIRPSTFISIFFSLCRFYGFISEKNAFGENWLSCDCYYCMGSCIHVCIKVAKYINELITIIYRYYRCEFSILSLSIFLWWLFVPLMVTCVRNRSRIPNRTPKHNDVLSHTHKHKEKFEMQFAKFYFTSSVGCFTCVMRIGCFVCKMWVRWSQRYVQTHTYIHT